MTSPVTVTLDREEIEEATHRFLGRFFVAFARLELSLALRVGPNGTFHDKLNSFLDTAIAQHGDSSHQFFEIMAWYMAADSLRETRNRFAHGRWAFHVYTQTVIHVSGYPADQQDERKYSLLELDAIVREAESLNGELCEFREVFV